MKKSQALKIIDDQYVKYVEDWVTLNVADEESLKNFVPLNVRILSALEQEGMLPPFAYLKKLGILDTAWEPEED
jgi:hypothetical protein